MTGPTNRKNWLTFGGDPVRVWYGIVGFNVPLEVISETVLRVT